MTSYSLFVFLEFRSELVKADRLQAFPEPIGGAVNSNMLAHQHTHCLYYDVCRGKNFLQSVPDF